MSLFYSCLLIFIIGFIWSMVQDFFIETEALDSSPISKEEYDRRKREESYVGPYDPLMGDKKPKK